MSTLSPSSRRQGSRTRVVAVVAAVVAVTLIVASVVWAFGRNDPGQLQPGAVSAATTPAATPSPAAAKPGSATTKKGSTKPGTSKPAKPSTSKPSTSKPSTSKVAVGKKLPAGIKAPGRKVVAPVDVNATAVADSVHVDLTNFTSVKSKANGPGEISAPAVRFTVQLTNTGSSSIALNMVVVNAYYGSAGLPGIQILGDPASKPFTGSLKPGKKATAVYVFNMPVSKRSDATITVSPSPTLPIAVFAGSVA
jgi:hypothetical protein